MAQYQRKLKGVVEAKKFNPSKGMKADEKGWYTLANGSQVKRGDYLVTDSNGATTARSKSEFEATHEPVQKEKRYSRPAAPVAEPEPTPEPEPVADAVPDEPTPSGDSDADASGGNGGGE